MNLRHDHPDASISIVQWTNERRGLRITLNEPTLKHLGWTKKTRLSIVYYKSWIQLRPNKLGNHLHQRGQGPALSLVSMMFPGTLKGKKYSRHVVPVFENGFVKINIPKDFFDAVS